QGRAHRGVAVHDQDRAVTGTVEELFDDPVVLVAAHGADGAGEDRVTAVLPELGGAAAQGVPVVVDQVCRGEVPGHGLLRICGVRVGHPPSYSAVPVESGRGPGLFRCERTRGLTGTASLVIQ